MSQTRRLLCLTLLTIVIFSCESPIPDPNESDSGELSIFFINDPHSQLENFAKIKHIVDAARAETEVLLVAGGDIFSGSPYVDQYAEKGYPIIDVMNQTGFDVAVIGNHEFDYGLQALNDRIAQSEFAWVCANVDAEDSPLSQPDAYRTLTVGDLRVTFLGLVETNGQAGAVIPATHPWRVADVSFRTFQEVVGEYADLKTEEEADVLVALTHLGSFSDAELANHWPFFDLIIGGHSNDLSTGSVNGIPTLMAGAYLSHLGRVDLRVTEDGDVTVSQVQLIDLETYPDTDAAMAGVITDYTTNPAFEEVIGTAATHHDGLELGCFYTNALAEYLQVDVSFQNAGGIRAQLDAGDITTFEMYSIDPFNNGSVIFTKTVGEIKDFLIQTGQGLHVSGLALERVNNELVIRDPNGNVLPDETVLTVGINDYLPARFPEYFDFSEANIQPLTTAETLIDFLRTINSTVAHEGCNQYFRY